MNEEEAFLQKIIEELDDPTPRLIFSDWLEERGDPRGELMRIDCQLPKLPADDPRLPQLLARKRLLRQTHKGLVPWERQFALSRIKKKIVRLRQADPGFQVFGSESHKHQLGPVLSKLTIVWFEREHQVALPEEYRMFLLEVGNGGMGPPLSGLYSLAKAEEQSTFINLARPFPVSGHDTEEFIGRCLRNEPRSALSRVGITHIEDAEAPLAPLTLSRCQAGCLPLADFGGGGIGIKSYLVVSGEQRGFIWLEGYAGLEGCEPDYSRNTGEQKSFFAWYEKYLDTWLAPGAIEKQRG
jgi:uncharacterized protein (TIGR02996 family)